MCLVCNSFPLLIFSSPSTQSHCGLTEVAVLVTQHLFCPLCRIKITHTVKYGASQLKVAGFFLSFSPPSSSAFSFFLFFFTKCQVWLMSTLHHSESVSKCCVLSQCHFIPHRALRAAALKMKLPSHQSSPRRLRVKTRLRQSSASWSKVLKMKGFSKKKKKRVYTVNIYISSQTSTYMSGRGLLNFVVHVCVMQWQ